MPFLKDKIEFLQEVESGLWKMLQYLNLAGPNDSILKQKVSVVKDINEVRTLKMELEEVLQQKIEEKGEIK